MPTVPMHIMTRTDDRDRSVIDHSMDVGNMHFRKPVENRDGYFAKRDAVDPATGEKTYASRFHPGMNYAHPVMNSGKPVRYFQFMMEIVANPGITRKEIIAKVYPKDRTLCQVSGKFLGKDEDGNYRWEHEDYVHPSQGKGYMNSYFSAFSADGFVRTTTKGELFPTKKLILYVRDHIGEVNDEYTEKFDSISDLKSRLNESISMESLAQSFRRDEERRNAEGGNNFITLSPKTQILFESVLRESAKDNTNNC